MDKFYKIMRRDSLNKNAPVGIVKARKWRVE